jgi:hypothetical protein
MRKVQFSDQWGEFVEYKRYRGRNGRFITAKYAKRWLSRRRITEEVEQWRIVGGRRTEMIMRFTPSQIIKSTYPISDSDHDGNIADMIEQTNIFSQVSKAYTAFINIRGYDEEGKEIRLQSEITFGESNQHQQLTWAVRELLAGEGYRTQYALSIVKIQKVRNQVKKLEPLSNLKITVTLNQ